MGWRFLSRRNALYLLFPIYWRRLQKEEKSNLEGGASFYTRHSGTVGWRILHRRKALHLRFSIYWRRLRKGEDSNLEGGASFYAKHRGTADWRILSRGKALFLLFSIYWRGLQKGEKLYREGDGANQAVRCVWQRSALQRPSEYAASVIARRCVFGDRLMPADALLLSIPTLQRGKGVIGRANGHILLSP